MQDVEVERTIVPAEQKEFDMSEVENFFTDGEAYERRMGRWSRIVGEAFLNSLRLAQSTAGLPPSFSRRDRRGWASQPFQS